MDDDTTRPFSRAEALRFGWRTTLANLKPLLMLSAVGGFLALLGHALNGAGGAPPRPLLGLGVQVFQAAVTLALIRASLRLHDGRPIDLERPGGLLEGFFPYLLANVLCGVIVVGGLVLLIVPGVLWALQLAFAPFLAAESRVDPVEALRGSSRLTRGVRGHLFGFALLLACTNLLGALALGVGLLVTIPTSFLAVAYAYRRLQARAAIQPEPRAPAPSPTPPAASA